MQRYYQEFINRFWSGGFLSEDELGMFAGREKRIKERGESLEEQALENLYRRGVQASGIGDEFISTHVTKPTIEAYAQLDFAEAQMADKRRQEAMNYAMMKYQEEQKRSAGLWGSLGKLGGAVAGGAIGTFLVPGLGTAAGAGLGASLFGGSGGGGGGGDAEMMAIMKMFQATQGNITFEEMMMKLDELLQQNTMPTAEFPEWGSGY